MSTLVPGRPLDGRHDRIWRIALIGIAALLVVTTVGGLATLSLASALERAAYSQVPAEQTFGTPEALTVSAGAGNIAVVPSDEVTAVTVRMRTAGDLSTVRARVAEDSGRDGRTVLRIEQPRLTVGFGTDEVYRIELLVPRQLAAQMDLTVSADVGEVSASGAFSTLSLRTGTGNVDGTDLAVTGSLDARADVGDVSLRFGRDAVGGTVAASTGTGDITIAVPGTMQYLVRAGTDVGTSTVSPGIDSAHGYSLTARSQVGDVRITR